MAKLAEQKNQVSSYQKLKKKNDELHKQIHELVLNPNSAKSLQIKNTVGLLYKKQDDENK